MSTVFKAQSSRVWHERTHIMFICCEACQLYWSNEKSALAHWTKIHQKEETCRPTRCYGPSRVIPGGTLRPASADLLIDLRIAAPVSVLRLRRLIEETPVRLETNTGTITKETQGDATNLAPWTDIYATTSALLGDLDTLLNDYLVEQEQLSPMSNVAAPADMVQLADLEPLTTDIDECNDIDQLLTDMEQLDNLDRLLANFPAST